VIEMRDPKEIIKDKEANLNEIKKWLPHVKRESAKKELERSQKKDAELEKELNESIEEKYKMK
jgi:hypothetical protein